VLGGLVGLLVGPTTCSRHSISLANNQAVQRSMYNKQPLSSICVWGCVCRAFEKLAHPTYGVMGIEYRPVDCYSKEPLK
jgi:hypothetical protein